MTPWAWTAGACLLALAIVCWRGIRAIEEGTREGGGGPVHDLAGSMTLFGLAARWRRDPHLKAAQERLRERQEEAKAAMPPADELAEVARFIRPAPDPLPRSRMEILAELGNLRVEATAAGEEDIAIALHELLMFRFSPPRAVMVRRPGYEDRTN